MPPHSHLCTACSDIRECADDDCMDVTLTRMPPRLRLVSKPPPLALPDDPAPWARELIGAVVALVTVFLLSGWAH